MEEESIIKAFHEPGDFTTFFPETHQAANRMMNRQQNRMAFREAEIRLKWFWIRQRTHRLRRMALIRKNV